jgi:hypothetical protein
MASEIVRVWLADPLDGWDPATELPPQATREQAEIRATAIRMGIERFVRDVAPQMLSAYLARDWIALEYPDWPTYVRERWGVTKLRLSTEDRQTVAKLFRLHGASTRAIGAAVGADQRTVRRDLEGAANAAPETVTGTDGKTYPAKAGRREHCSRCGHACAHDTPCILVAGPDGPVCEDRTACDERLGGPGYIADPERRLAAVAELAPEYVREVEWPQVAAAGGAVASATPAGPTAEAPADEAVEVSYRGWRKFAGESLNKARKELALVTGDFLEAGTVAQRGDEALIVELEKVAAELGEFCRQVRQMRGSPHGLTVEDYPRSSGVEGQPPTNVVDPDVAEAPTRRGRRPRH